MYCHATLSNKHYRHLIFVGKKCNGSSRNFKIKLKITITAHLPEIFILISLQSFAKSFAKIFAVRKKFFEYFQSLIAGFQSR
jgi:hypothetical protein